VRKKNRMRRSKENGEGGSFPPDISLVLFFRFFLFSFLSHLSSNLFFPPLSPRRRSHHQLWRSASDTGWPPHALDHAGGHCHCLCLHVRLSSFFFFLSLSLLYSGLSNFDPFFCCFMFLCSVSTSFPPLLLESLHFSPSFFSVTLSPSLLSLCYSLSSSHQGFCSFSSLRHLLNDLSLFLSLRSFLSLSSPQFHSCG
jgi:hypothetical protein